jgi:inosine-uridine nucleoside N-ribohydrolase
MKDDPRPLYVLFLGPLTDLASAYLQEPRIANRLTAIWIGGGAYPSGSIEFNLSNDIHAANVVFSSPIPLWQVPRMCMR